jgi:hypothetical protein
MLLGTSTVIPVSLTKASPIASKTATPSPVPGTAILSMEYAGAKNNISIARVMKKMLFLCIIKTSLVSFKLGLS